ncbi:ATP-dependent nuclease [Pseudoglutamicibacter albus]|uniref:ATP-dependent endonuclease of OLD family n=1 Tax=Pseudoglutamicibacter albus TaxID=98671 RepID=A0ABU1YWR6_9MICC|nr:AAA family ATPase [Pseudoglutamicibacter albus]MDR7292807.1 putative ATP-dependent endonuclease of OLD family [Pseudoglutamicibacter albus]
MQITRLRLSGFQSFGPDPTTIELTDVTYVLGPNGAGKTAVLEALTRLFSPLPAQRKIKHTDFHIPSGLTANEVYAAEPELWIEVDIEVPEAGEDGEHASVPPNFAHMRISTEDGAPGIRVRLTATIAPDHVIDEKLQYVLAVDSDGEPLNCADMSRFDRANIEVHYLPARRDPTEHIAYTAASVVGRALRAAEWTEERDELDALSEELTNALTANSGVRSVGKHLAEKWKGLHTGGFFTDPSISFGSGDLESVLRQLTVAFAPSPDGSSIPFDRLSDGQKSLLYISLVLAWQALARKVLDGSDTSFDQHRLRPPVHTVIALEEPENSLAPQFLGRINRQLRETARHKDSQSLIATHSPALLSRVAPEDICFLRLDQQRQSKVRRIVLPKSHEEAEKYVREAVVAFPELYFARLVVLGEGASEQIVLPRVLAAAGIAEDDASVVVVPLGGRHVNHFWRLLTELVIPHVTLLDLDSGRYQGGWGRVRNALRQYNEFNPGTFAKDQIDKLPAWNSNSAFPVLNSTNSFCGANALKKLEEQGVYFSHPLDLDLMMLESFPEAYGAKSIGIPDEKVTVAVLGESHTNENLLPEVSRNLFADYHRMFNKNKPASHLKALSSLSNEELKEGLPGPLARLVNEVECRLESLPE